MPQAPWRRSSKNRWIPPRNAPGRRPVEKMPETFTAARVARRSASPSRDTLRQLAVPDVLDFCAERGITGRRRGEVDRTTFA